MSGAGSPPPSVFSQSCSTAVVNSQGKLADFISLHVDLFNVNSTSGRDAIPIATNVDKTENEEPHRHTDTHTK